MASPFLERCPKRLSSAPAERRRPRRTGAKSSDRREKSSCAGDFSLLTLLPFGLLVIAAAFVGGVVVGRTVLVNRNMGEALVANTLAYLTQPQVLLNNVTLPTGDGTTQTDHILVTESGIFVIETSQKIRWLIDSDIPIEGERENPAFVPWLGSRAQVATADNTRAEFLLGDALDHWKGALLLTLGFPSGHRCLQQ